MYLNLPWNRVIAVLCLVSLWGTLGVADALGQKKGGGSSPPPGPVPPGTIYFSGWVSTSGNSGGYTGMTMNGDGSDKKEAFGYGSPPSYQLHGQSRWFLYGDYDWDGPVDAWGNPLAYELFAVNQQNQWIQLTADPNIHWTGFTDQVAWGKDDSFVSFAAWTFTGNGDEVRGGLYIAEIDWSTGVPVAGPPTLLFEAQAYWFYDWVGTVNLYDLDWAPAGNAVVFRKDDETVSGTTYLADFSGEETQFNPLAGGVGVRNAVWSPDGSRVAYGTGEIWTINPDGTNALRLTQRSETKTGTKSQAVPSWSPDGAYIAYVEAVSTRSSSSYSILRIPAGGGSSVNLTSDLLKAGGPKWRP
jgi:hypothetical protein